MKNMKVLVALSLTFLMLIGPTTVHAETYISDPISPDITKPSEEPEAEPTPAFEGEPSPVPEAIKEPDPEERPTEEASETEAVIQTEDENGSVNIRAAASMDAEIIGQMSRGDRVVVLGLKGDWAKIRANGTVGYVFSKYVNITGPESTPADEEAPTTEVAPAPEATLPPDRSIRIQASRDGSDDLESGEKITLTAYLAGYEGLDYRIQWQFSESASGKWYDISDANRETHTIVLNEDNYSFFYRATVIINEEG